MQSRVVFTSVTISVIFERNYLITYLLYANQLKKNWLFPLQLKKKLVISPSVVRPSVLQALVEPSCEINLQKSLARLKIKPGRNRVVLQRPGLYFADGG